MVHIFRGESGLGENPYIEQVIDCAIGGDCFFLSEDVESELRETIIGGESDATRKETHDLLKSGISPMNITKDMGE
jgi:hypothetical protein